jgi:hypothetical protein
VNNRIARTADLGIAIIEPSGSDAVDGSSTGIAMCQSCGV